MQDILERQTTGARQALRRNPNAWQQARPRAAVIRAPRPARMSFGTMLQRLLEQGAACNAWKLLGAAVLAWSVTLFCTAWLLGVFS